MTQGYFGRMNSTLGSVVPLAMFFLTIGNVMSSNYPNNYWHYFDKIRVEEGLVVAIEFTAFDLESDSTCSYDHLTIKNGDGTTLMEKTCGSSLPAAVTSKSNVVMIYFHSNDDGFSFSGWRLTWRAVTPGAKPCFQLFSC